MELFIKVCGRKEFNMDKDSYLYLVNSLKKAIFNKMYLFSKKTKSSMNNNNKIHHIKLIIKARQKIVFM